MGAAGGFNRFDALVCWSGFHKGHDGYTTWYFDGLIFFIFSFLFFPFNFVISGIIIIMGGHILHIALHFFFLSPLVMNVII